MVIGWQPIASIPEGVDVLTAGGNGGIVIRRLRLTDPDEDGVRCPFWYRGPDMDEGADDEPPTHWTPLPEFP